MANLTVYIFSNNAFLVYNWWTIFIIFLFFDQRFLENGERGKNGSSQPSGVLSLRMCPSLHKRSYRNKIINLFLHSLFESRKYSVSSTQNDVPVKHLAEVILELWDTVEDCLGKTVVLRLWVISVQEVWLEQHFRTLEALTTQSYSLQTKQNTIYSYLCAV